MKKLYTVKEVCEKTGINGKLLYDYCEQGIIWPTAYANFGKDGNKGYKLFDEAMLTRIHQIAIFRELGMERAEIKKKFLNEKYDSNQMLKEQIELLKQKKARLDKLIFVAENLQCIGLENTTLTLGNIDINSMAEVLNVWINSDYYKELSEDDEFNISTNEEKELKVIFNKFVDVANKDSEREEYAVFCELLNKGACYLGFEGVLLFWGWIMNIVGGGENAKSFYDEFGKKLDISIANKLLNHMKLYIKEFGRKLIGIISKNEDVIGLEYQNKKVKKMVDNIKDLCNITFGMRNKEEYDVVLSIFNTESLKDEIDDETKFVLEAIKYYL